MPSGQVFTLIHNLTHFPFPKIGGELSELVRGPVDVLTDAPMALILKPFAGLMQRSRCRIEPIHDLTLARCELGGRLFLDLIEHLARLLLDLACGLLRLIGHAHTARLMTAVF